MAIIKIKPIKSSWDSVTRLVRYICNPSKTNDGLYVSGYGCSPESAIVSFQATHSKGTGRGNRLAYHLIQSFDPEDNITPDQALEIGQKLAQEITGKKNQCVVSTHVDRGHVHNHIAINAVDFVDFKKYHMDQNEIDRLMEISDRLCRENGASIIEKTTGRKGLNKGDYEKAKRGKNWKTNLADAIDDVIMESKSFDEFLEIMDFKGIRVRRGKHISFKYESEGQEKAVRGKSIGEGYTENAIIARITGDDEFLKKHGLMNREELKDAKPVMKKRREKNTRASHDNARIKGLVDTGQYLKRGYSKNYINKVNAGNVNQFARFMKYMEEHQFACMDDLRFQESEIDKEIANVKTSLDNIDKSQQKYDLLKEYFRCQKTYIGYKNSGFDKDYYDVNRREIDSFNESKKALNALGIKNPRRSLLNKIFEEEIAKSGGKGSVFGRLKTLNKEKAELQTAIKIYQQTYSVDDREMINPAVPDTLKSQKKDYR